MNTSMRNTTGIGWAADNAVAAGLSREEQRRRRGLADGVSKGVEAVERMEVGRGRWQGVLYRGCKHRHCKANPPLWAATCSMSTVHSLLKTHSHHLLILLRFLLPYQWISFPLLDVGPAKQFVDPTRGNICRKNASCDRSQRDSIYSNFYKTVRLDVVI